jgi:hypothetical protein
MGGMAGGKGAVEGGEGGSVTDDAPHGGSN